MNTGKPMANHVASKRVGDFVFMSGVVAVDPSTRRAVCGYDDIPLAEEMTPALTSVRIPLVELGQRAGSLALHLLNDQDGAECQSETLSVELIRRGTA